MKLKAAFAIALLLAASAAPAQRAGSHIGRTSQIGSAEDARQAVQIVADCVAGRMTEWADRWLQSLPGSRDESTMFDRQRDNLSICMDNDRLVLDGRELGLYMQNLRRPLALALVKRRVGRAPEQSPMAADSNPWFMTALTALPQGAAVDRAALVIQDFGHCVVVSAWGPTRAFLGTTAESPEEAVAARLLRPHLGPCLTEGVTVAATPSNLRNVLAEPFLHVLAAAPARP